MRKTSWLVPLSAAFGAAALGAACGNDFPSSLFSDRSLADASLGDGLAPRLGQVDAGETVSALSIEPIDPTLDVASAGVSLQFTAKLNGQPVAASWNLDTGATGTISPAGLFVASGTAGGVVNVFAEMPPHKPARTTLTVKLKMSDNPGNVADATKALLRQGGSADSTFAWLYPYDGTVFPRELLPPLLQFAGGAAEAFRVSVRSNNFEYEGFYPGANPLRVTLPPELWKTITTSAGSKDPVRVDVTKISGGAVTGPITESWNVAQGSLRGIVYYNTYDSPLAERLPDGGVVADAGNNNQGAVMRIRPSASRPEVFIGGASRGGCTVCHSVSAHGEVMTASVSHAFDGVYRITPDASAPSGPTLQAEDNAYAFGALTPDGKYLLSCGAYAVDAGRQPDGAPLPPGSPPGDGEFGPNLVSMLREQDSKLIATSDGGVVSASILDGGVKKAMMPSFSLDAKTVAFVHHEMAQGHSLSAMDFDSQTGRFSNLRELVRDLDVFFGWPAFLPDGKFLVYQVGDRDDYATWRGGSGELLFIDLATKTAGKLRLANGVRNGQSYLQSPGEIYLNYEPTVLPVSVGGYYWVVFTSRRKYGNVITESDETETIRKKLWVAAIDTDVKPDVDPSHPAFYLPGQELESGNLRGFWALEPCRQVGVSCESGSECCSGFCRQVTKDGRATFACVEPPSTCAREEERCEKKEDCCDAPLGYDCIAGHCARPTPH